MSVETEMLSAIVKHKSLKEFVDAGLNSEYFTDAQAFKAYAFIAEFNTKHGAFPDAATVEKTVSGVKFDDVKEPITYYCEQLYAKHRKDKVKDTFRTIAKELEEKPEDAIKRIETLVMDLQKGRKYKDVTFLSSVDTRTSLYKKRKEAKGIDGVPSGLPMLDRELNGFKKEDFIIISGRQKVGKSFLLAFLAMQFVKQGLRVLFLTKEMSIAAIQSRVECMMFKLPYTEFKMAKMKSEDEERYLSKMEEAKESTKGDIFYVQDVSTVSGLVIKAKEYGVDIIVVDGLYLLDDVRAKSPWEKVTNVSRDLKKAAQTLRIPLIASTQLNRSAAGAKTSPKMESLSFSDALGQDADAVMGLYQTEDMREDKKMFVRLMGSRESDKCTLMLDWDIAKMKIQEAKMDKKSEALAEGLSDDELVSGTPAF